MLKEEIEKGHIVKKRYSLDDLVDKWIIADTKLEELKKDLKERQYALDNIMKMSRINEWSAFIEKAEIEKA